MKGWLLVRMGLDIALGAMFSYQCYGEQSMWVVLILGMATFFAGANFTFAVVELLEKELKP